ncbi:hypothetical protein [Sphingobium herbicidovorans]|nr:hypothetical protein [Sphingobium herbicidovorans]
MDAEHHDDLVNRARRFFLTNLDTDLMTILAYRNPALAGSINNIIIQGRM